MRDSSPNSWGFEKQRHYVEDVKPFIERWAFFTFTCSFFWVGLVSGAGRVWNICNFLTMWQNKDVPRKVSSFGEEPFFLFFAEEEKGRPGFNFQEFPPLTMRTMQIFGLRNET